MMQTIGVIGAGRMGRLFIESFTRARAHSPESIAVCTRSPAVLGELSQRHGIRATRNIAEIAAISDILVLCVPTLEQVAVLRLAAPALRPTTIVVSIAVGISLAEFARIWSPGVVRVIPTVTLRAGTGSLLVAHGEAVPATDLARIEQAFSAVGPLVTVNEADLDIAVFIASAGPALLAACYQELLATTTSQSRLDSALVERLLGGTLAGVSGLLSSHGFSPQSLIDQVTTKGGVTEAGLEALRPRIRALANDVHEVMTRRLHVIEAAVAAVVSGDPIPEAATSNGAARGTRIAHIGVAVRDLDESLALYRDLLGLNEIPLAQGDGAKIAGMAAGSSFVEFLEARAPDSPIAKFVAKRGAGIHHVCFAVDDLDGTLERCRDRGIRLVDETPRPGCEGKRIAFLHPASTHGVLVELTEH